MRDGVIDAEFVAVIAGSFVAAVVIAAAAVGLSEWGWRRQQAKRRRSRLPEVGDLIAPVKRDGRTSRFAIRVSPEFLEPARRVVRRGTWRIVGRAVGDEVSTNERAEQ